MDDIYEAMIGAAPQNQAQQTAVAGALRRRRALGELGNLTGDQVLQSFGAKLTGDTDAQVKLLQDTRQKDADNAQTKSYQDAQLKHMGDVLAETKRNNDMMNQSRLLQALAAMQKAENAGKNKPGFKMTLGDRRKLEDISQSITQGDSLGATFKDEYAQKLGAGPQSKLPNTLSSVGLGSKGMDEAANWWAQWNLVYSMPQRHATFGATLTPGEKQSWLESDINPSMDPKTIKERVQKVMKILKDKGGLMDKEYRALGAAPELMDIYGLGQGEAPPSAPAAEGALTPEEAAELDMLRKKHGRK